jgi:hypothetical protein
MELRDSALQVLRDYGCKAEEVIVERPMRPLFVLGGWSPMAFPFFANDRRL